MRMSVRYGIFWVVLLVGVPGYAIDEVALERQADASRFSELSNILRCMVCQNQSIADSNATLARDFRNRIKEKLNAGQTNEEIIDFMVARYGDYVLYRPPFNGTTALLWLGPFVFVVIGFVMIVRMRRRPDKEHDAVADEATRARLEALLNQENS